MNLMVSKSEMPENASLIAGNIEPCLDIEEEATVDPWTRSIIIKTRGNRISPEIFKNEMALPCLKK